MKTFLTPDPLDSVQVIHFGPEPPSNPWVGMLWIDQDKLGVVRFWNGISWISIMSSNDVFCKILKKSIEGSPYYTIEPHETVLVVDFDVFGEGPYSFHEVYLPHSSSFSLSSGRKKLVVVAKSATSHPMAIVVVKPSGDDTIDGSTRPVSITAPGGSVTFVLDRTNWVTYQRKNYITGYYYQFQLPTNIYNTFYPVTSASTTLTVTANRIYYIPVILNREYKMRFIGIEITTPASGNFTVGVYRSNNDMPDRLLYTSNPLSTATAGLIGATLSVPLELPAGVLFWVAVAFTATPTVRATTGASLFPFLGISGAGAFYTHMFGTGGGLPNPANATSYGTGNIPLVYTKFNYV